MNNYQLNINIEPKDKFEKAEQDLLKAMNSFSELNKIQQEKLIKKYCDINMVRYITETLYKYFNEVEK